MISETSMAERMVGEKISFPKTLQEDEVLVKLIKVMHRLVNH